MLHHSTSYTKGILCMILLPSFQREAGQQNHPWKSLKEFQAQNCCWHHFDPITLNFGIRFCKCSVCPFTSVRTCPAISLWPSAQVHLFSRTIIQDVLICSNSKAQNSIMKVLGWYSHHPNVWTLLSGTLGQSSDLNVVEILQHTCPMTQPFTLFFYA